VDVKWCRGIRFYYVNLRSNLGVLALVLNIGGRDRRLDGSGIELFERFY